MGKIWPMNDMMIDVFGWIQPASIGGVYLSCLPGKQQQTSEASWIEI